jgi:hypothetical protein
MKRKIATSAKPKVSLVKEKDGMFALTASAGLLKTRQVFTPGIEFEEQCMDGGKSRSIINFQGNTMVHRQKGDREVKIVREFSNEKLTMTIYADEMIARRYFSAV